MKHTGFLPSPIDPRDWDFADSSLYGAAGTKRKSIDATGTHIRRFQGAQSCTAYAVTTAIQDLDLKLVELRKPVRVAKVDDDGFPLFDVNGEVVLEDAPQVRTTPLPLLSGAWSYQGARRMWFKQFDQPIPATGIPDGGSSYRHNIMWARDGRTGGGPRAETVFPDIPENIPRVPSAAADQAPPLVLVDGYYRIHGELGEDALRNGFAAALDGFLRGECSKPMGSMFVGPNFASLKEGDIYDDATGEPEGQGGGHAMLISGDDAENDCAVFDNTWPGTRTFRARIPHLADLARKGYESWVLRRLIYIPQRAA